jgi:hypothetical protein
MLTSIDSKIEDIHQKHRDNDGKVPGSARGWISTEQAGDISTDISRPCQHQEREDGRESAGDHEGFPLAPS